MYLKEGFEMSQLEHLILNNLLLWPHLFIQLIFTSLEEHCWILGHYIHNVNVNYSDR